MCMREEFLTRDGMELCLGTVQFGMDYGIRAQKKPSLEDAVSWIDYATHNGIEAIDTARAYGTAEEVVGDFLKRKSVSREKLFISTKLKPNLLDDVERVDYERIVEEQIKSQLDTLHTDYVDAYVYHSARYAFDDAKLEAMSRVVEKGLARKCGVSVYEPEEADSCFNSPFVDFIQAPYSVFDHRMKQSGMLDRGISANCEIHTRSAFIQGLIVMEEDQVPGFLNDAKPIVRRISTLCNEEGISRVQLALQYVKREKSVSHLVFGVDSLEQLKEDIRFFYDDLPTDLLERIGKEFDDVKADIVMPSLWKR